MYLLSVHPNQPTSVSQLSKEQSECRLLKHHIVVVKRQKALAKTGFLPKVHCRFSLCGWSNNASATAQSFVRVFLAELVVFVQT